MMLTDLEIRGYLAALSWWADGASAEDSLAGLLGDSSRPFERLGQGFTK